MIDIKRHKVQTPTHPNFPLHKPPQSQPQTNPKPRRCPSHHESTIINQKSRSMLKEDKSRIHSPRRLLILAPSDESHVTIPPFLRGLTGVAVPLEALEQQQLAVQSPGVTSKLGMVQSIAPIYINQDINTNIPPPDCSRRHGHRCSYPTICIRRIHNACSSPIEHKILQRRHTNMGRRASRLLITDITIITIVLILASPFQPSRLER